MEEEILPSDELNEMTNNDDELFEDIDTSDGDAITPIISAMIAQSKRHPLLTAEQERELSRQVHSGNLLVARAGRDKLVVSNIRLVIKIAKRYSYNSEEQLDFIQEGFLGLHRAAEKYDGERGFRFSTYATWWIKQSIQKRSYNYRRVVSVPTHFEKRLSAIRTLVRDKASVNEKVTVTDVMERCGIEYDHAAEALAFLDVRVSLSQFSDKGEDDDSAMIDRVTSNLPETEEGAFTEETQRNLKAILDEVLRNKERKVIEMRFGLTGPPMVLDEVGEQLGLTRERIRQIEGMALRRLRHYFGIEGISVDDMIVLAQGRNDIKFGVDLT